jgi:hypothetical protein
MPTSRHLRHPCRHPLPCLLVAGALALAAPLAGADGTLLTVAVESLPTDYRFTIRDNGAVTTGSESFDQAFGASLGLRGDAPVGTRVNASYAVELAAGAYASTQGDHYLSVLGRLVLGYGYRVGDDLTIGAEAWVGAGHGDLHIAGTDGATDADASGAVVELGARLVADYALAAAWYVRGGIGWQHDRSYLAGAGLEVELSQSGPVALIGLAWRF